MRINRSALVADPALDLALLSSSGLQFVVTLEHA
jgi:hypothetical protein